MNENNTIYIFNEMKPSNKKPL